MLRLGARTASPFRGVSSAASSCDKTRTTWGANAFFEKQVLLSDSDETNQESITLTFTTANWSDEQTVTVRALDDDRLDGKVIEAFLPAGKTASDE